jgi:hypothetical protein
MCSANLVFGVWLFSFFLLVSVSWDLTVDTLEGGNGEPILHSFLSCLHGFLEIAKEIAFQQLSFGDFAAMFGGKEKEELASDVLCIESHLALIKCV